MNKAELVEHLAREHSLTRGDAEEVVGAVAEQITRALAREGEFKWPGLGTFKVTDHKARVGRNPKTGAEVPIPARRKVKFVPAKSLRESVGQPRPE